MTMRIRIKNKIKLALDCRTQVLLEKGEFVSEGDKDLKKEDLQYLVDSEGAADVSLEEVDLSTKETATEEDPGDVAPSADEPVYKSFTKKPDLEDHAREEYGVELDKRLSLKKMVKQLEDELGIK